MRALVLILALFRVATSLVAGTAAEQLAQLRPLAFDKVKSAAIARLDSVAAQGKAFHGQDLASPWTTLAPAQRDEVAATLRGILGREIEQWTKAGDGELVILQPFGFVPGDFAVRLETDRGVRDFSVAVWSTGYIHIYDEKKHTITRALRDEDRQKLQRLAPAQRVSWKSLGQSVEIIGKLGVPLATAVEIEAAIVRGEDTSRFAWSLIGAYVLKVEKVAGQPLATPALCLFRVTESDVPLAASPFGLYELKEGKPIGSLTDKEIAELEKGYIGSKHRLLVFEEGSLQGYPPKDLPEGFSFLQMRIEPGLEAGESVRFRPIVCVLRELPLDGSAPVARSAELLEEPVAQVSSR